MLILNPTRKQNISEHFLTSKHCALFVNKFSVRIFQLFKSVLWMASFANIRFLRFPQWRASANPRVRKFKPKSLSHPRPTYYCFSGPSGFLEAAESTADVTFRTQFLGQFQWKERPPKKQRTSSESVPQTEFLFRRVDYPDLHDEW